MNGRIKYNVLSKNEMELFIDRMKQLLMKRGITITHLQMREELIAAGCTFDRKHIYFTEEVIEKALKAIPKEFTLYAPDPANNMKFPHPEQSFYTRTCTGAPNFLPVEGEKHLVTLEDSSQWFHLANALENISYVALPSTCDESIPEQAIDVFTLEKALQISKKHIWIQPYEGANTKYLIEMCAAAAGGMEQLRKKPIASFIACSVPVLKFKDMDAEILYECAKAGVPVQTCALPTAGANTPATAQGNALAACADILAQIVMLQTICPGLPVIATPLLFSMDMKTTYTLQSNTENTFGRLICMQIFEQGFGIPCHSYGTGTDSHQFDEQNMIERTSLIHMMAMSDASVLGGAGQLETAMTISPLALIIDNEIFGIARRLRRGLEINDETLNFEELLAGKDKGGYLMSMHTYRHMHDAHRPELFYKGTIPEIDDPSISMMERVRKKYQKIMETPMEQNLSEECQKQLHDIVLRAAEELTK